MFYNLLQVSTVSGPMFLTLCGQYITNIYLSLCHCLHTVHELKNAHDSTTFITTDIVSINVTTSEEGVISFACT